MTIAQIQAQLKYKTARPDTNSSSTAIPRYKAPKKSCIDCGLRRRDLGWVSAIVPAEVLNIISPNGPEILCFHCIAKRCAQAGLKDIPIRLDSKILRSGQKDYQFLDQFAEHMRKQDKAPKTIYNYVLDVKIFFNYLADKDMTANLMAIDTEVIIGYRNHQQNMGKKPNSVNRTLTSLNLYFEWLIFTERIIRNPARFVKRVAQVDPKPRKLSREEVDRYLEAVEKYGGLKDKAVIMTLIHTGVRAGELSRLKWNDIKLHKKPNILEVHAGKGNKDRVIPLNSTVKDALLEYKNSLTYIPKRTGYVFHGDKPLPQKTLFNLVRKFATYGQVEDISAHDFRHYFAYRVVEKTSIHILKELLGHADIGTTAIYTGPTIDDLVSATQNISI